MQQKKIMAMLMVSLFFIAGCLGAMEEEVEIPEIDLPLDWTTIAPYRGFTQQFRGQRISKMYILYLMKLLTEP